MMLKEVARFLASNGLGIFDEVGPDSDIFIGPMPESPDNLIALFQYAGRQPLSHALDRVQRPGLQIMCRAVTQADAYERMDGIERLLDQFTGHLDGVYYNMIRAVQAPFFLEQDTNERVIVTQNYYIDRRQPE